MAEKKAKGIEDLRPEDFDANGELVNKEQKSFYDAERAALLGEPVDSGINQTFPTEPPPTAEVDSTVNPPKPTTDGK